MTIKSKENSEQSGFDNDLSFQPEVINLSSDDDTVELHCSQPSVLLRTVKEEPLSIDSVPSIEEDKWDKPFPWENDREQAIESSSEEDNETTSARRKRDRVYVDGATIRVGPKSSNPTKCGRSQQRAIKRPAVPKKTVAKKRSLQNIPTVATFKGRQSSLLSCE